MSAITTVHTAVVGTRKGGLHQLLAVAAVDPASARAAFDAHLAGENAGLEEEEYRMTVAFHRDRGLAPPDREGHRYECREIESYEPDEDGDYPDRRFEEAADEPGRVVLIESGGNG